DSRPSGTSSAAIVRLLPMMTHWAVGRSVPSSSAIVGNATMAELVSNTVTKIPVTQTKKTWSLCCKPLAVVRRRRGWGRRRSRRRDGTADKAAMLEDGAGRRPPWCRRRRPKRLAHRRRRLMLRLGFDQSASPRPRSSKGTDKGGVNVRTEFEKCQHDRREGAREGETDEHSANQRRRA